MLNLKKSLLGIMIALVCISLGLFYVFRVHIFEEANLLQKQFSIGSPFQLIDQRGDIITEQHFLGHPSAIFFGFTNCPEVCPSTLWKLSRMLDELGKEASQMKVYFITLDPGRDTPAVLNSFLSAFNERITGITGISSKVESLAKSWKIYWERVDGSDGEYSLDHTASVLLLNSKSEFVGTIGWKENETVAMEKLRQLAKK